MENIFTHYQWGYILKNVTIDNGFPRKPHPASYDITSKIPISDLIIGDRELRYTCRQKLKILKTCLLQKNNQAGGRLLSFPLQRLFSAHAIIIK